MRKVLLFACVAALLQNAASADVTGTWSNATDGTFDRWTFTVTPSSGVVMAGFDVALYDDAFTGSFAQNGLFTSTTVDQNTHFLVQLQHSVPQDPPPPITVVDANSLGASISSDVLTGTLTFTRGGIYDQGNGVIGLTSAFDLLQVVVPTGTFPGQSPNGVPLGLSIYNTDYDGAPTFNHQDGTIEAIHLMIPEPGTLSLLGCGLFALAAYVWRRRK